MINILVSKLKTSYQVADPAMYIIGDWQQLDPVFVGRLAYLAKIKGVKVKLTEGYRSTARQTELYNQYREYMRTGKGSVKLAARPGTSWHEFRLAVDTSTQPIRGMGNGELKAYGLCKPIKSEGWHIQPLETSNTSDRRKWEPVWEEDEMTEEQVKAIVKEVLKESRTEPSAWAAPEWDKAKQMGIVDGTSPQAIPTREQVAAMVVRALAK